MRILVTGADGYIGTRLVPVLRARGHDVVGFDTGFYAAGWLDWPPGRPEPCRPLDTRDVVPADVRGMEAVVHLAELSNDPLGQLAPEVTHDINYRGTLRLAQACRAAGVGRFVYSSSCSVYGAADGVVTERSPVNPQTAYAHCKVLCERALAAMAADDFSPTILRNATAFGASPRMRFDIVLNNLAGLAWTRREIRMTSDGTPWRPLVHVLDICEAMACVLEAPREAMHGAVFNVGDDSQNYRVRDIAAIVAGVFPGCALTFGDSGGDTRSYRVAFDRIHELLPAFRTGHDAVAGALELRAMFEAIDLSPAMFQAAPFTRLHQLQTLLASGRLDKRFRWSDRHASAA